MIDGFEKTVDKLIDRIKTRIYGKTFRCPVCHLELSFHDINENGLVVCPLCGIVIEVADVFGHALPVVHNVEIKRHQPKLRIHPISTHLPIGLFPFSVLLSLFLVFASFLLPAFNNHCVAGVFMSYLSKINNISQFFLIIAVIFSVPAFLSGLYDWYFRYEKRRYKTITVKITLSIVFFVLGLLAFCLHHYGLVFSPETGLLTFSMSNIFFAILYFILMLANMICLATIGHLGGLLVFGK